MSCRHDALFLHFSRIVENLWTKPLCQLLPDNKVLNSIRTEIFISTSPIKVEFTEIQTFKVIFNYCIFILAC